MQQPPWQEYYDKVIRRPHHPIVEEAVALTATKAQRSAVDCGCGAGRDTAYLLTQGFDVYAFDSQETALKICEKRFADSQSVQLAQSSFETFDYPAADLIVANLSLFFCDPAHFQLAWKKLTDALQAGGVFCGDLMGIKDDWLRSDRHTISAFTEEQARALFADFDIVGWREHDEPGRTALGREKHWHYYSILATKKS